MQLKLKILIKKAIITSGDECLKTPKDVECVQKEFQTEAMQNPEGQQFLPCGCAG